MTKDLHKLFLLPLLAILPAVSMAQENLADSICQWTAARAAAYYQQHADRRQELRPLITARFLSRQDTMSYWQLRSLRRTFWNTDMQDSVNAMYLKRREEMLPLVEASADSVCNSELAALSALQSRCKAAANQLVGATIEQALRNLASGFLPDGRDDAASVYRSRCLSAISVSGIKALLNPMISAYVNQTNNARKLYINKVAGYGAASGNYRIGQFGYTIRRMDVDCPTDDLMQLVNLQGKINWLHLGIDPNTLLTPGTGEALLAGRPLIDNATADRNCNTRRLAPIANNIAAATARNIQASVYETIDAVFATVAQKVKDSQPPFKKMVAEKY